MRTQPRTRLDLLRDEAEKVGLTIACWNPQDKVGIRYRFFNDGKESYNQGDGIYTALGFKQADIFVTGYIQGYEMGRWTYSQEYNLSGKI